MNPEVIARYKAEGWTFEVYEWESGHNGDEYTDYHVKSPRLHKPFNVGAEWSDTQRREIPRWETMTEKQILKREAEYYAFQRAHEDYNRSVVQDAVIKALRANPDAKKITITVKLPV
jgi:hypothetical protein